MQIKIIDPLKYKNWDEFVKNHSQGSVFHLSCWAKVIIETYNFTPFYLVKEDGAGRLEEGWPFFSVNDSIYGRRFISIPFTDHLNPLIDSEETCQLFLDKIIEIFQKERYKYIEIRGEIKKNTDSTFKYNEYFKNFVRDLRKENENTVWETLHDSVKRGIKKAHRLKLKTLILYDMDAIKNFYKMNVLTRRKHGVLPQPYLFFINLWKYIIQRKYGFVILAILGDTPISGAVFLCYNHTLFYKYGASHSEYLMYRPNNLIFWEAIKWAIRHNYAYLDLGRTAPDNHGLMQFKRHWGAQEVNLLYYYYPNVEGAGSMKHGSIRYKIVTSMFKKMPTKLLELFGNNFYRYLA